MRLLPRRQMHTVGAARRRFNTDKFRDLVPAHAQQRPRTRMPHHGVRAVTGIDAQLALPGVILELQLAVVLEHSLTAAINPQLAFLLANLAVQLVITLRSFEPRQRY